MTTSFSLTDTVANHIRELIELHKILPGELIPLDEIERNLKVSRTPIREAIRKLELEHLIDIRSGKGVRVSAIEESEVDQLYQFRMSLESEATRRAALQINALDIELLKENLKAYENAVGESSRLAILDRKFHYVIFESLKSEYLSRSLKSIRIKMGLLSVPAYKSQARSRETLNEHAAIVEALVNRNPDAASKAAEYHVKNTWKQRVKTVQATI